MKRKQRLCLLLAAALLLTLCACGRGEEQAAEEEASGLAVRGGEWIGEGGCYTAEPFALPENCQSSFLFEGERWYVVGDFEETLLLRGEETVCRTESALYGAEPSEEGIWLHGEEREDGVVYAVLRLLDGEGRELRSLRLEMPEGSFPLRLTPVGDLLVLNCSDALRVYGAGGEVRGSIPHAEWSGRLVKGGDGRLYFVEEADAGGSVSLFDPEALSLEPLFVYERGTVCAGDAEAPLLLIRSDGIRRLRADGSLTPLVLWEECGLSVAGITGAEAQPDGSYLLAGTGGCLLLRPAEPSALKPRTLLTIGVLPDQGHMELIYGRLIETILAFNAESPDCAVRLLDLTDDGSLTREQALTRLSTQLIAGEGPDLLVFDRISPFPYIRRGLLRDLRADLETDPEVNLDDLITASAICNDCGGLYLLSDSFVIDARAGLRETFGDRWGWSFAQYRELDRARPEGTMVMYNLTRDNFLRESAARYARQAIDWSTGGCDFDTPEFIAVLEACRDMRETPEDPENMVFGLGWDLLDGGYLMTDMLMIASVASLAEFTRHMSRPISVVGWPTPDGSCGSDLRLTQPMGVLNTTAHPEECWRFCRYVLTHSDSALPAYRPLFDGWCDYARNLDEDSEPIPFAEMMREPLTEAELAQLEALLANIEHTTLYDEQALTIIEEEAQGFLAGDRSAEETAKLIQSRISLYVSEQSG